MMTPNAPIQQQFVPPMLAPDLHRRRADLQRNQMLAQQLLRSESPQGQMVSGHFVAPHFTQQLAHFLSQGLASKLMRDVPQQQSDLQNAEWQHMAGQFGFKGTPIGHSATLAAGSEMPSPQTYAKALGGELTPAGQINSQGPMLLPGMNEQQSMLALQTMGPHEYMKLIAQHNAPTDVQRNLIAQGIQPGTPQWNEAMSRINFKGGYVAPVSAAPGTTLVDPQTNQPVFSAPQNGIQTTYGPAGPQSSVVPGYAQANANVQGAEAKAIENAKAEADLVEVVDENGGKRFVTRSQAINGGYKSAPSSANAAYDEAQAKQYSALSDQLTKMGMEAPMTLAKLDRVEQLIGDFDGGKLTGMAMSAAEIGNSLGINLDPKLGDKQAASALMNEMALKLKNAGGANQMPGAMSDSDRQFLLTMSPQLSQSSEGRKTIIQTYRALAHREQQVARMADAYRERNNGRLDAGFTRRLSEWSSKYPLFGGK